MSKNVQTTEEEKQDTFQIYALDIYKMRNYTVTTKTSEMITHKHMDIYLPCRTHGQQEY